MRKFTLTVPDYLDGKEIKYILRNYFKMSAAAVTRLKNSDGIMLNGKKEYVTKTVSSGDFLIISLSDTASRNIVPNNIPIDVLYEDDDILAVNKPPNMPTHPSVRHFEGTLANAVAYYFKDIPFTFRAVSRLDRDTSGVVVIAKNSVSAAQLSQTMQSGNFSKEYAAVCVGIPSPISGKIDAPIKREKEGIIKRCIASDGKKSVSEYELVRSLDGLSLLRLVPLTGRTHQLRLHLAYIGTPIFADYIYGTEVPGERIRLHCRRTSFPHPISGRYIEITAPMPEDMSLEKITENNQEYLKIL